MPFLMLYSHTFKREPNMSHDWAAVAATWRLNTHICCKGALSDPLGTRIGIEIKDVQRRCCLCGCWPLHSFALDSMRWALCQENIHTYIHTYLCYSICNSCQQLSSEPITSIPLHAHLRKHRRNHNWSMQVEQTTTGKLPHVLRTCLRCLSHIFLSNET